MLITDVNRIWQWCRVIDVQWSCDVACAAVWGC